VKNKVFFIAEISANHCGNFNLAKKLIKCAHDNGADAVKLQTYTADTMTVKSDKKYFKIKNGLWKGYTLWDLYNRAHTPLKWHKELFKYAKSIGIKIFSTPFDDTSVDFLEKLKCPIYKIASFEMTDLNLVKKISQTKKPIIISTGMASLDEISATVKTARRNGAKEITLLYCVSNYPSNIDDFNLKNIEILKKKFKCKIGISDHSKDNRVAIAAVASGAEVIEKHIALDNQKKGFDINFSLKGREIKKLREDINIAFKLLGKNFFYRNKSEDKSKIFRRSIFAIKNIKKGDKFAKDNIRVIRPGHGLEPKYFNQILNKKSPINILKHEPIKSMVIKKIL
tara:strand:- start:9040 stop:10059 length:1020 start_codon:yes stop_codon:yes gene_type:complete